LQNARIIGAYWTSSVLASRYILKKKTKANLNLRWENWHIKSLSVDHEDLILVSRASVKRIDAALHPFNPSTVDAQTGRYLDITA
jgi:TPP-dependent pyruvate/acetoin dehydrogenase alpha subunit